MTEKDLEIQCLRRENEMLRAENERLKKQADYNKTQLAYYCRLNDFLMEASKENENAH